MKSSFWNDLNSLVKCLHHRYGVGDIKEICRYADGKVEVEAEGFGMKRHTRKGHIIRNFDTGSYTVKMYRHQLTGIIVGDPNETRP